MVEPIQHSTGSSIATTGWETAKGGAFGVLAIAAVGAALGAAVAAVIVPAIPAIVIGALAGATVSTVAGAPLAATVGAIAGVFNGRSRVNKENLAYEKQMIQQQQEMQAGQRVAASAGLQKGYEVGFQAGQQQAAAEIQSMLQQQAGSHAGKCGKCKAVSQAEAVAKQREASAAAGKQI